MLKIAITGSNGLIGSRIIQLLNSDFEFIQLELPKFDITNKDLVIKTLNNLDFDILLHLAAYTNVDGAEKEKEKVWKVNVEGTRNLFDSAISKKKKMIYISTDFVFDGKKPPFFEDSETNPLSYYAKTKFEGEKIVRDNVLILRLAYPYRSKFEAKKDFVRGIKFQLEQKTSLKMITDSLITPTFVDDLTQALKYLLNNYSPEIFHIVGSNSLSWFDIGKLIANTFELDESLIQPTAFKEYIKNKAPRPQWSEIKSKKNNFYKMKSFEEGLEEIKKQT